MTDPRGNYKATLRIWATGGEAVSIQLVTPDDEPHLRREEDLGPSKRSAIGSKSCTSCMLCTGSLPDAARVVMRGRD